MRFIDISLICYINPRDYYINQEMILSLQTLRGRYVNFNVKYSTSWRVLSTQRHNISRGSVMAATSLLSVCCQQDLPFQSWLSLKPLAAFHTGEKNFIKKWEIWLYPKNGYSVSCIEADVYSKLDNLKFLFRPITKYKFSHIIPALVHTN